MREYVYVAKASWALAFWLDSIYSGIVKHVRGVKKMYELYREEQV